MTSHKKLISIVVPIFNEVSNLEAFHQRLNKAIPTSYDWELIWVDSCSTDGSIELMRKLAQEDKRIRAMILSKRFGHQIALTAGIDIAKGDCVITMDGDLQHPPEAIPQALQLWEKGFEIVFFIREEYSKMSGWKKFCSQLYYKFLGKIAKIDLIPGAADYRLMSKKVINYFQKYTERERFIRGIISDMGFKRTILYFKEEDRKFGESKYGLSKLLKLGLAGVVSFSGFPLRLSTYFGLFIALLCIIYAIWMIYAKFTYGVAAGIPSIIIGVFFIGGVQLISIGILGEYLLGVFKEVKARPLYCVDEIIEQKKT